MDIYKTSMGPMLVSKAWNTSTAEDLSNPGRTGRAWFVITPISVWQAPKDTPKLGEE